MNKKLLILSITIALLILFAILNFLSGNKIIENIYSIAGRRLGEEESLKLEYTIYDNQELFDDDISTNNVKTLVTISSNNGIEYIVKPEGEKINAYSKNSVSIDYIANVNAETTFKIKETNNINEVEKKIQISPADTEFVSINFNGYSNEVQFKNTRDTDITYYKYASESNPWISYKDYINGIDRSNQSTYITDTVNNTGSTKLFLKKEDIGGNILYSNIDNATVCLSTFDVFGELRNLGQGLSYYGFEKRCYNNEWIGFDLNCLGLSHGSGVTTIDGDFWFKWDKLGIKKADKLYINLKHELTAWYHAWVIQTTTIKYKDGTSDSKSTGRITTDGNSNTWLEVSINPYKEIDTINMHIEGFDPDMGSFKGYVSDIVFYGVTR